MVLQGLGRLATLELNDCELQSIEAFAFRGLSSLEFLRLARNSLEKIPSRSLVEHLQPQLYELNLQVRAPRAKKFFQRTSKRNDLVECTLSDIELIFKGFFRTTLGCATAR